MTATFRAHYDGTALIPDEPVDIPHEESLMLSVQAVEGMPRGMSGASIARFFGVISAEDDDEMTRAIEEGCGKVDEDSW